MGVKSPITLKELKALFDNYNFTKLTATKDGVIDTTYIASTDERSYILKRYERDIQQRVAHDSALLHQLSSTLNVPYLIDSKEGWYLYKRLKGSSPKTISYHHIQLLARFMAKLHQRSLYIKERPSFVGSYPIEGILNDTKRSFFAHYKKLEMLKGYNPPCDGFIHGDIFRDNTIFSESKIGIFDFIDGGCGSFAFDIAVALLDFNKTNKPSYNRLFLRTYNQCSKKRFTLQEIQQSRVVAAKFYGLLRIDNYKNTKKANELIRYI